MPSLPPGDLDARAELEALARRLAAAHEADPANANLARALTSALLALGGGGQPQRSGPSFVNRTGLDAGGDPDVEGLLRVLSET